MTRKPQAKLALTERALADLTELLRYSTLKWGAPTANRYLGELEAGLERIRQQPDLLQPCPGIPSFVTVYRVRKHLFVCDRQSNSIVVLAVIHGSMDLPHRLAELHPTLAAEVELLHNTLKRTKPRKD